LFENPSSRVYSSPKPTQPESKIIGEARLRPKKGVEIIVLATILSPCLI